MGLLTPLAIRIGAIPWMPKLLPQVVWTDTNLQRLTKGRVTILDVAGLPNLALTVPGRKSGVPRTTPLLCIPYTGGSTSAASTPNGGTESLHGWLIAGSNFGGPRMPLWVNNLRATKTATIRFKGVDHEVTWREIESDERAAMWQIMLRTWPNFAKYEQRTTRLIPVFYLQPVFRG